jgi:hypothetical protein
MLKLRAGIVPHCFSAIQQLEALAETVKERLCVL